MKLTPVYLDNDGNIIRKKKQVFYKKNRNRISKLSRKRNRQTMNMSKKRKRQNKKFTRAIVKPLQVPYGKTVQDCISKSDNKIIKEYKGKDKGCEPEFE